jgi:hypothetical protein
MVHRLPEGRRFQPASASRSGRHGRVGLLAEAAQDVVGAADELTGDGHRRPVRIDAPGDIGVVPVVRGCPAGAPVARLGQQCGDPHPLQLLDHEPPPGASLDRERHVLTADGPLQPVPQRFPADQGDPASPHLPGDGVQIVEGDLSTMDVEPSYDGAIVGTSSRS